VYEIVNKTDDFLVLKDIGGISITNDAENVVTTLHVNNDLKCSNGIGKRLFYVDSTGQIDELLYEGPKFLGYHPGHKGYEESELLEDYELE
jgi:hypothetical protein